MRGVQSGRGFVHKQIMDKLSTGFTILCLMALQSLVVVRQEPRAVVSLSSSGDAHQGSQLDDCGVREARHRSFDNAFSLASQSLSQVIGSVWYIQRSCSPFDHTLVQIGSIFSIFCIVRFSFALKLISLRIAGRILLCGHLCLLLDWR